MDNDTFQQVSIVQEPYKPKCLLRRSLCPSPSKACAVAVEGRSKIAKRRSRAIGDAAKADWNEKGGF